MQPVGKEIIKYLREGMQLTIFENGEFDEKAIVQSFGFLEDQRPNLKVLTEKFNNPNNPVEFRFIENHPNAPNGWYYFSKDPLGSAMTFSQRGPIYTFIPHV